MGWGEASQEVETEEQRADRLYPEHVKLKKVSGHTQEIHDFLEWMETEKRAEINYPVTYDDDGHTCPTCNGKGCQVVGDKGEATTYIVTAAHIRMQNEVTSTGGEDRLLYCETCDGTGTYPRTITSSLIAREDTIADWMAEFYDIDMKKIDKEKDLMLSLDRKSVV